jgi:hypothetical protein
MQNLDSNQTQFSEITPVFESASTSSIQKPAAAEEVVKKKNNLPLLIGIFGLILFFIFLVSLILIKNQMGANPAESDENNRFIDQTNGSNDPLLEEIYDLDDQLQSSDPTIDEIPFPPVDMTLRLDAAKKK